MLDKAIYIAAKAFVGKYDKGGQPYILHCLHVMNEVKGDETLMVAAVLHDVIEDTNISPNDLRSEGIPENAIRLIEILTHREEESYDEYIQRISLDSGASKIKRADLRHNSDIMRMKGLGKKDMDRLLKYHRAYAFLKDV